MLDLIRSIQERDSANPTFLEVVFGYNGFHAVLLHRLSHGLWRVGLRAFARFMANLTRILTGVEIHPQAQIGRRVFIDHGTGIVIGQTAVVGDDVNLYHDVTLGGVSEAGHVVGKRHPTIKDKAVIGAGSQVLGNITIGEGAKVGANSVVLKDVPDGCTVVGNPARLVKCKHTESMDYGIPENKTDPVGEVINGLLEDVKRLKLQAGIKDDPAEDDDDYTDKWMGSGI